MISNTSNILRKIPHSTEPDLNQRPRDISESYKQTTVSRSTN